MIFNNLLFIFCFLPFSLLLYYIVPKTILKNLVLLIVSLIFYSWANPFTLVVLFISIAWNYLTGLELSYLEQERQRKLIFWISVAFNLLILGVYKYLELFFHIETTLIVPMGLSFFTFSSISYIADVYMGKVEPQKNIISYSLYVAFFGKISMGPIVQYHAMEKELSDRLFCAEDLSKGSVLFIKGLIKKVLLADQFSFVFTSLQSNNTVVGSWLLALAYALQLYFDFSGYSDMAIGISNMFGFHFDANFDHPYIATSIQDFWRRWHISLSRWFRDYIYIPLGGNRVDTIHYVRNILIVWLCTGIWHGANWTFIVWGLYYAAFLLMEKFFLRDFLEKLPSFVRHIYSILVILFGWVFFFSPSISDAFMHFGHMFGVNASWINEECLFLLISHLGLFILGIILSTPIYDRLQIVLYNTLKNKSIYITTTVYIVFFIVCIAFIVGSSYQSFLYFAF